MIRRGLASRIVRVRRRGGPSPACGASGRPWRAATRLTMGEVFFLSDTPPSVAGSLRDRRDTSPASGRGSFAYAERGGDPASCGVQSPSTPAQAARRSPSPRAGRRRCDGPCLSPPHEMGRWRDAQRRDGGALNRITSPNPAPSPPARPEGPRVRTEDGGRCDGRLQPAKPSSAFAVGLPDKPEGDGMWGGRRRSVVYAAKTRLTRGRRAPPFRHRAALRAMVTPTE